uniref:GH16 domain-containing protein n=1 Tax=Panagrolaimus sp. ES5 TaxID=591445 RepID=A0AC34FY29_9BILA
MKLILLCCLFGIALACNLQSNKDIDGHDLSNRPGQLNDCCGICQSTSGCQAFSWTNYNGGTCWLKTATGPVKDGADVTLGTLGGGGGGGYSLRKTYEGNNFFDGFYFWNYNDPTHGCVKYVDKGTAQNLGLIGVENGKVRISSDSSNTYFGNDGRPAVRIHSNDKYNDGLFIFDLEHMPVGPGTWPAYWFCGDNWPNNGEIDVLEGVDGNTANNQALHTNENCYMPLDASIFKGRWAKGPGGKIANDCYVNAAGQSTNQGCSITSEDGYFGVPFNNAGGGVFALEWSRDSSLKIWIFKRNELPADINSGNPNPSNWGKPEAYFTIGNTCNANHFNNHEIIINLTFCGDWAGNVYNGGMAACENKVRSDPGAFKDAYWLINHLKYYSH